MTKQHKPRPYRTRKRSLLTAQRLRELVTYDPDTGVFVWIGPKTPRRKAGDVLGTVARLGYLFTCIDGPPYGLHRLAWLYMTGVLPAAEIDHINLDPSDNRWCNLREATRQQNNLNRRSLVNTSGVKGVMFDRARGKWSAFISIGHGTSWRRRFTTKDDAVTARRLMAALVYGEFNRQN